MARVKVSAKQVITDIKAGMDDVTLMRKYQLSADLLHSVFRKLMQAGVLTEAELNNRIQTYEETVNIGFGFAVLEEPDVKELEKRLIKAAKVGDLRETARSINKGANVNCRGRWGMTPLMWAASKGHLPTVRLLLDKGADVNAEANNKSTALMWTSFAGYREVVEVLLFKGARVNVRSVQGKTALISAALNGHTDIVKLLLGQGADVNARDSAGKTALTYAAEKRNADVTNLLKKAGGKP